MQPVKLSIVTASHRDPKLFRLIDSFVELEGVQDVELLLVLDVDDQKFVRELEDKTKWSGDQIRILHARGKRRVERKDIGAEHARAEYVCFMDSDCMFDENYLKYLLTCLEGQEVIRGGVKYRNGMTWIGTMNSYYRSLADEELFREETFTPNLILRKDLLQRAGGWSTENIDEQDDSILSQRIKPLLSKPILHIPESYVWHDEDTELRKLKRTWIGYGTGYGFRYWREVHKGYSKPGWKLFKSYIPPFPFRRKYGAGYFIFCLVHFTYMCIGYRNGLRKFRNSKQLAGRSA